MHLLVSGFDKTGGPRACAAPRFRVMCPGLVWQGAAKVRLLARPRKSGFQGAYGGGRLWELTCGVKEHLLRRLHKHALTWQGTEMPSR